MNLPIPQSAYIISIISINSVYAILLILENSFEDLLNTFFDKNPALSRTFYQILF